MKRKYFGINSSTAYKRVRRAKKAYHAATDPEKAGPSVSSASSARSPSPEQNMPETRSEVSAGRYLIVIS